MSRQPQLSAQQEAEAQRIFHILKSTTDDDLLARMCRELHDRFGIEHATFQVEAGAHACPLAPAQVV